jgi:hypothetical protein
MALWTSAGGMILAVLVWLVVARPAPTA